MYSEGVADLYEMIMLFPLCPPDQKGAKMAQIKERTTNRYFPAFEKVGGLFSVWHTEMREDKEKSCLGSPGVLLTFASPEPS